jgi:hypothetical protein
MPYSDILTPVGNNSHWRSKMTTINYRGVTPLKEAIADLYGCSKKNNNKIAKLIKDAKAALAIESTNNLTEQQRIAIYNWHVKKLSFPNDMTTDNDTNDTAIDELVKNAGSALKAIANDEKVYKQVNIDGETKEPQADLYPDFKAVKLAFYTVNEGVKKRRGIDAKGYFLNALMLKTDINKQGIPAWIQDSLTGMDTSTKLIEKVEKLIIERLLMP